MRSVLPSIRLQVGEDPEIGLVLGQLDLELAEVRPSIESFIRDFAAPVRTGR